MKKIFTLLVLVLVAVSAMAQDNRSVWNGKRELWTRGEGTAESPYLIESAENLAFLSYMCASGYETYGLHFKLTTDIDLNCSEDRPWNPIGVYLYNDYQTGCAIAAQTNRSFQGHFDGDGHCIYNLYIEPNSLGGLFGDVIGSRENQIVIENIKIMSGTVTSGGIARKVNKVTIRRCANKADVINETDLAGGIVGEAITSVIEECYNEGKVNGKCAGGIVGCSQKATFQNCYNVGDVDGVMASGGCVGYSYRVVTVVENSYNVGSISCDSLDAGGLIGIHSDYDSITNSYFLNTCGALGLGTPKTAEEMRDRSFVDVLNSRTNVWGFDEAFVNQGFPILENNHAAVDESMSAMLRIYPNPANDVLVVECGDATAIAVYDILGQCVRQVAVANATTKLDVADLESGVYILSVSGSNRPSLVTRFVVSQ